MEPAELKRRREALGMTQEQLAHALGFSHSAVWRWEAGQRKIPRHFELVLGALVEQRRPSGGASVGKGG